jgi:serine/threonine protein phosphatase PrpC
MMPWITNLPIDLFRAGASWNRRTLTRRYLPEIECGGLTVVGPVREDNQDAIHLPNGQSAPERGLLYAVADGMGGYAHGAVASTLTLEVLSRAVFEEALPNPKALRRGVENANFSVYKTAQRLGGGRMGTTLTAAYVLGDMLHMAHVGDSRAYLIRDGQASCLTADHTTVGDMVRANLISPDKIRTHAQRSILTKAVGLNLFIQPDLSKVKLQEDDCLILCSDGVWSVVEDDEFARVARDARVGEISRNLIDLALGRQTDDNASAVVFRLRKLIPVPADRGAGQHAGWLHHLRKLAR